jgi:predicted translin family RNA/ssDNA-binding protein
VIEEQVNQQQFEQLDLLPEIEIVKDDPFNSHKSDLDLMGNEVKLAIQKVKYLKQNLSKFNGRLTTWRKRRSCLWN